MAQEVQLRRGTTTEHNTFTGAAGELTVDTTKNTAVIHDGSTAGGYPLQKELYEFVTFGTEDTSDTLAAGKLMYLATDDKWRYADADSSATGGNQLLALAIGDTVATGLLVKGLFTGTITDWDAGLPVYISTTVGTMTTSMPTGTGDIVRKVGYCTPTTNQLLFDPSSDFIELA